MIRSVAASLCAAFSMFSIIPMPRRTWSSESLRFMLCFFPLVGALQAAAVFGIILVCRLVNFNVVLSAVLATLVPVVLSGGIHVDGLADTTDALASRGTRAHRLYVMRDSRVGTFAVITIIGYFFLYAAFWTHIWQKLMIDPDIINACARLGLLCCASFVTERAFSAVSVAFFPKANPDGLARRFGDSAKKSAVAVSAAFYVVLLLALNAAFYQGLAAAFIVAMDVCVFAFYFGLSQKYFGGITGDTSGWYLQWAELAALSVPALIF